MMPFRKEKARKAGLFAVISAAEKVSARETPAVELAGGLPRRARELAGRDKELGRPLASLDF